MKKILFVCLGNICRSPGAEAVFNALIEKNGLENDLQCDSAGTAAYHIGEPADARMRLMGIEQGYNLTGRARRIDPNRDFDQFQYIIGMDRQNIRDLKGIARNKNERKQIFLMTDFCINKSYDSVPDPYFGGDVGFELVFDILEDACEGLLRKISNNQ